jgi:AraC-like DNA-binding protein
MAHAGKTRAVPPRAIIYSTGDRESPEAYEQFQDSMRGGFLPWSGKKIGDAKFRIRIEAIHVDDGFIGRVDTVDTLSVRTKSDISASSGEYVYASFNLFGTMTFEQNDEVNVSKPGDLVIFDSGRPARVSNQAARGRTCSGAIALMIPKSSFPHMDAEASFANVRIPRERLLTPLSNSLNLLTNRMPTAAGLELAAIYDACVDLLPIAVGAFDEDRSALHLCPPTAAFREVLSLVEGCITDTGLSASYAAEALGLSERYVHKLFAKRGTTFGAYVTEQRLTRVREDLMRSSRYKPITAIAYRWGFNDLSTFNRAFRKRFGCTPTEVRRNAGIQASET